VFFSIYRGYSVLKEYIGIHSWYKIIHNHENNNSRIIYYQIIKTRKNAGLSAYDQE